MKIKYKIIFSFIVTVLIFISTVFIIIPPHIIFSYTENNLIIILITLIVTLLITTFIMFLLIRNISNPISKINSFIKKINNGKIIEKDINSINNKDEIGSLSNEINKLYNKLTNASNFAEKLKEGKFEEINIKVESKNIIDNALREIQEYLISVEKEKKYSIEENKKVQWFQNGIADFTKLLQQDFNNTEEMAAIAVKKIVKYIEIEQAGLFVLKEKDDKKLLILEASYAYDKKKMLDAEVEIGEGLVGKCAKEQKIIKIDDLPEGYTFIGSGLGEDTPKSLLLIPMIFERNLYGIIEIASLFKIPEIKIEFLKSIGERIAAEISSIKKGLLSRTLAEDFKKQAEELAAKEAETSNTIGELQKIRDDFAKQAAESSGIMKALVSVASVVFYDMKGRITNINQKNLELFNIKKEDQIGKTHFEILKEAKENPEWFKKFWNDLQEGKTRTKEYYIKNENQEMWLFETFTPILNKAGVPEKVINIGIDITEQKLLERNAKIKE